jgi:hypothetical protein
MFRSSLPSEGSDVETRIMGNIPTQSNHAIASHGDHQRGIQGPTSVLCASCQKWDFKRELLPTHPSDLKFKMRIDELEAVRKATNCPLCRLRISALQAIPGFDDVKWERSAFVHTSPMIFGGYSPQSDPIPKSWVARIWVQLLVDGNNWSNTTTGTSFSRGIQLLADIATGDASTQLLRGRLILGDSLDFDLLRSWLSRCSENHGSGCAPDTVTDDFCLRVIDVGSRRVVEAPPSCRYLALSYVWGDSRQLLLEQNTYARLTSEGGLDDQYHDISSTIKDAMLLCEKLKESYLWVDALCIMQDDDVDRSRQIANMHAIYGSATLTVVAAAGKPGFGASAGIPGVRAGSRDLKQCTEIVNGLSLITSHRPFLASMSTSEWNKRGWTFQEKLLSKRLLICCEHQAFYHCNRATWYEDAILEGTSDMAIDLSENEGLKNRRYHQKPPLDASPMEQYSICVAGYGIRSLKFDADALNAFNGIIKTLKPKFSSEFIYGMPESLLDTAMTWRCHNHFPERRRNHFPSWSWLGTRGGPNDNLDPQVADPSMVRSEVVWYRRSTDNGEFLLVKNNAVPKAKAPTESLNVRGVWKPTGSPTEPHVSAELLDSRNFLSYLYFWTSSAHLIVDREGVKGESRHGTDYLHVRSVEGDPVGVICLNKIWRQVQPDKLEFIVICSYDSRDRPSWNSGLMLLLIERQDWVAFRVQRIDTPIAQDVWAAERPEWKFFVLG